MHYVSLLWRDSELFVVTLWKGLSVMVLCLLNFWDFMDPFMYSVKFSIWLVELVVEAFISHLEFSSVEFNVMYLGGT